MAFDLLELPACKTPNITRALREMVGEVTVGEEEICSSSEYIYPLSRDLTVISTKRYPILVVKVTKVFT